MTGIHLAMQPIAGLARDQMKRVLRCGCTPKPFSGFKPSRMRAQMREIPAASNSAPGGPPTGSPWPGNVRFSDFGPRDDLEAHRRVDVCGECCEPSRNVAVGAPLEHGHLAQRIRVCRWPIDTAASLVISSSIAGPKLRYPVASYALEMLRLPRHR